MAEEKPEILTTEEIDSWEKVGYWQERYRQSIEGSSAPDPLTEYRLGSLYYLGNGIRADTGKGLEYLQSAAAHGNEYAANLLRVIWYQQTVGTARCATSLIAQLGRIFQKQEQKQSQRQNQRMDRKLRREMREKKQALGLRDSLYLLTTESFSTIISCIKGSPLA